MKHKEDNWFSNFLPCEKPIVHRGISYRTLEHYYQALKTEDFELRRKIAACSTPGKAKRMGQTVPLRQNWGKLKVIFMESGLREKFCPGSIHYNQLMQSKGDIVEWNNWHDNFWGSCTCIKCKLKKKNNMLGKLLMKMRREYKLNETKNLQSKASEENDR